MFEEPPYALRELYVDNPVRYRILTAFLANPTKQFTLAELSEVAEVSESSLHRHKNEFIEGYLLNTGFLKEASSKGRGRSHELTVNLDSELAQIGVEWFRLNEEALQSTQTSLPSKAAEFYE